MTDLAKPIAADLGTVEPEPNPVTAATGGPLNSLITEFVGVNPDYYTRTLKKSLDSERFQATPNRATALVGSVWFAARGLWSPFFVFLIAETLALIQIARGMFGDLGSGEAQRAADIAVTLEQRRGQLEAARAASASTVDNLESAVSSLEVAVADSLAQADAAAAGATRVALIGIVLFVLVRAAAALLANPALQSSFSKWRSDRSVASGLSWSRAAVGTLMLAVVAGASAARFARPDSFDLLAEFPTNRGWQKSIADWIESGFDWATTSGDGFFLFLTRTINGLLDAVETVFVGTPWPVMLVAIGMLGWLTGGHRVAIFVVAGLMYLGLLDFWEKAMTTVSLVGTAALISISFGIPLGVFAARRPGLYRVLRPILDFMQSMPSFVYLIPVVAFFGAGKTSAVTATLIFGSSPVIRFTVLGLQQVPKDVREAAMAFGATDRYLLFKVDLPLAARTIRAGANQTILLSLAMVVVASLIGAKGLGEDVLEALQFANQGLGILAGLAILVCALILDRIIVGKGDAGWD